MDYANIEKIDYQKIWDNLPIDYCNLPPVKVYYSAYLRRALFYPANKMAYGLLLLVHRKSFTKKNIDHLKRVGFPVEVEVKNFVLPDDI